MSGEVERRRLVVLAQEVREEHAAIEAIWRNALERAIAVGEKLIEAKSLVRHGEWGPWLESAGLPHRTASTYMRLARESGHVADLPTVRQAIAALTRPQPASAESPAEDLVRRLRRAINDAEIPPGPREEDFPADADTPLARSEAIIRFHLARIDWAGDCQVAYGKVILLEAADSGSVALARYGAALIARAEAETRWMKTGEAEDPLGAEDALDAAREALVRLIGDAPEEEGR
jgi:hypothetical protein